MIKGVKFALYHYFMLLIAIVINFDLREVRREMDASDGIRSENRKPQSKRNIKS